MKKVLVKLFILISFVIGFFVIGVSVSADTDEVYLIMTNPGENCDTEMNVVWHSKYSGTLIEYTTSDDTSFTNKKSALPKEEELEIYDGTTGGNVKDYKCEVTLKNLAPDTEYIYRVGLSTKSSIYRFKTGGSKEFSFAVVSDIHTYSKLATRLSKANTIIHNMENNKEISMIVAVGDIMAYGTNRGYWDDFTKSDMVKNYMVAPTPGNHDYYNSSANFLDSSYFNAYTNNPDNGCDASFNTTYYFYYGDVLFISLNSEDACTNSSARSSQRDWLEKVLQENELATYKIVYFHRSMYPGSGSNTGHASTMKGAFQDLFDRYGIDLVFGGHDHVYVRTKKIINGVESQDTNFGTTYISLPQIGDRASSANSDMTNIAKKIGDISGAVLVTVSDNQLSFSLYDDSGNILDSGGSMNKMNAISKNKVNNGIKITYDGNFSNMTLTVPEVLFQRAYNIKVIDKSNDKELLSVRPSYEKTDYRIMGISDYIKQKDFSVVISYRNGTTFTKDITVKNNLDYGKIENIRVEGNKLLWTSALDSEIVEEVRVIENNTTSNYSLTDSAHDIKSSLYTPTTIIIQVIAVDGSIVDEFEIPYGIDTNEIVFAVPEIITTVNNKIEIEIVNSMDLDIPFSYEYDENYIKMIDGNLYAIKEGSTTIICKNEYFEDQIVSVTINPPKKYVVSYEYNGGTGKIESEEASSFKELNALNSQNNPSKEGYNFEGWYLDNEYKTPVNPDDLINSDIVLYAKWSVVETSKASGCNKASLINLFVSLSLSFGCVFILKKKH